MSKAQFDFAAWLSENADEITQAQAFAMSAFPDNPAAITEHLSRATAEYARIGYLLADAERFFIGEKAKALRDLYIRLPELTAEDRKSMVLDAVKDISRVRDVLQTTVAALKQRSFGLMNIGRIAAGERSMSGKNGA